ncbi:unnamed protein product [Leptidea sinapis]|uniref:Uncharacterized protein n=1 Tax=Leptidea sinapis TaxID=189913 RepID=A0A5E4QEU0_9NEOP|nr:unnamed protein product [Leptidea sinapis]
MTNYSMLLTTNSATEFAIQRAVITTVTPKLKETNEHMVITMFCCQMADSRKWYTKRDLADTTPTLVTKIKFYSYYLY